MARAVSVQLIGIGVGRCLTHSFQEEVAALRIGERALRESKAWFRNHIADPKTQNQTQTTWV